jgi:hypothetical protein
MASKQEIREYFAKFGKQGGKARAKNMTPEERSEAARKAVAARWAKTDKALAELEKRSIETAAKIEALETLNRANSRKAGAKKVKN